MMEAVSSSETFIFINKIALSFYLGISLEGLRRITKHVGQDSQYPDRESNRIPSD
jgi:hypothetical protein